MVKYCCSATSARLLCGSIECTHRLAFTFTILLFIKMLCILSNKTINTYLPVFPTKGLHNWWHFGPVYIRLYSSTSLFHCKTTIYDMIHKCGSDFIWDSDSSISTSSSIMSSSNTTTTYSYMSSNCSSTSMLLQFRVVEVLHSQKMVVIVLSGNLHIYAPKLDWLNGWMVDSNCIAIRGNLPI